MEMNEQCRVVLKIGREKSLLRKHPWIFSGAVGKVVGKPSPGNTVTIVDMQGNRRGVGAYSPASQIVVRMWSFNPEEKINTEFFFRLLQNSVQARQLLPRYNDSTAWRLVFGEADGLPGLVVDRYGDYLAVQFLTIGAEFHKDQIIGCLQKLFPRYSLYERSDEEVRKKEGLESARGIITGEEPPELIRIKEGDGFFWVDIKAGQKTGFYLDQKDNRQLIKPYACGLEILNCFAYTGGFTVPLLQAGAQRVLNVDTSETVLNLVTKNIELNRLDPARIENITGDVFQVLRQFRDINRQFDMIILDPPRFADSRKHYSKAARGYKDINWLACRLLSRGGILVTFSCSGGIAPDLFQKIVADAAADAGRSAQIIQRLTQSADHPVALNFPESAYLKGLICRIW